MDKENLNEDEISLKFNALAQKLQEGKIEFSYLFKDQWISQEVNNVTVTVNSKMLSFHLIGSDRYGTWTQMGAMTVSKSHQVETFSRKIYDDYNLQGGNVLIYYGKYDEQNETLHGNWYCNNIQETSYTTCRVIQEENGLQNLKVNEQQNLQSSQYQKIRFFKISQLFLFLYQFRLILMNTITLL